MTMLDAVYWEGNKHKRIIAIRPKPPFRPIFQVAAKREGSGIHILNQSSEGLPLFLVETGEALSRAETQLSLFEVFRMPVLAL